MNRNSLLLAVILTITLTYTGFAQEGRVDIQQDPIIPKLLEIKSDLVKTSKLGDRYRIQIFSGDNNAASTTLKEYRALYSQWPSTIVYDTPNYKVWVGNYRSSLEADRALYTIKENFPAAFRLKPERK